MSETYQQIPQGIVEEQKDFGLEKEGKKTFPELEKQFEEKELEVMSYFDEAKYKISNFLEAKKEIEDSLAAIYKKISEAEEERCKIKIACSEEIKLIHNEFEYLEPYKPEISNYRQLVNLLAEKGHLRQALYFLEKYHIPYSEIIEMDCLKSFIEKNDSPQNEKLFVDNFIKLLEKEEKKSGFIFSQLKTRHYGDEYTATPYDYNIISSALYWREKGENIEYLGAFIDLVKEINHLNEVYNNFINKKFFDENLRSLLKPTYEKYIKEGIKNKIEIIINKIKTRDLGKQPSAGVGQIKEKVLFFENDKGEMTLHFKESGFLTTPKIPEDYWESNLSKEKITDLSERLDVNFDKLINDLPAWNFLAETIGEVNTQKVREALIDTFESFKLSPDIDTIYSIEKTLNKIRDCVNKLDAKEIVDRLNLFLEEKILNEIKDCVNKLDAQEIVNRFNLFLEKLGPSALEKFERLRLSNDRFFTGLKNCSPELLEIIKNYLNKFEPERGRYLEYQIVDFVKCQAEKKEEQGKTLNDFFEELEGDFNQREALRKANHPLYELFVIYRYTKYLKHFYKVENIEDLKKFAQTNPKLQRAVEVMKLAEKFKKRFKKFVFIEDEQYQEEKKREEKKVYGSVSSTLYEIVSYECFEINRVLKEVDKIKEGRVVIIVPNRRAAWTLEYLIDDWDHDPTTFDSPLDKNLFALDVALKQQDKGLEYPAALIETALEYLKNGKINHFKYLMRDIKISSSLRQFFPSQDLYASYQNKKLLVRLLRNYPVDLIFIDGSNPEQAKGHRESDGGLNFAMLAVKEYLSDKMRGRIHFILFETLKDDITELSGINELDSQAYQEIGAVWSEKHHKETVYYKQGTKEGSLSGAEYMLEELKDVKKRASQLSLQSLQKETREKIKKKIEEVYKESKKEKLFKQLKSPTPNFGIIINLIKEGADISARDEEGNTPLMIAAKNGWKEVVKIILLVSSDKEYLLAKNSVNQSALDMAANSEIRDLIKSKISKNPFLKLKVWFNEKIGK